MCFKFFSKKNKQASPQSFSQAESSATVPQQSIEANNSDFKFMLIVENALTPDGHREILEPTAQQLQEAIETLKLSDENFLTLESGAPINNITFLQATGYDRSADTLYVEAQLKAVNGGNTSFHIYSQTFSVAQCAQILNAFMQNTAPNINLWDYIMEV